jgi:hypothetical protein
MHYAIACCGFVYVDTSTGQQGIPNEWKYGWKQTWVKAIISNLWNINWRYLRNFHASWYKIYACNRIAYGIDFCTKLWLVMNIVDISLFPGSSTKNCSVYVYAICCRYTVPITVVRTSASQNAVSEKVFIVDLIGFWSFGIERDLSAQKKCPNHCDQYSTGRRERDIYRESSGMPVPPITTIATRHFRHRIFNTCTLYRIYGLSGLEGIIDNHSSFPTQQS